MRIIITVLLAFLAFSCSTNENSPTTNVAPLPPTELTGSVSSININQTTLNWTDNSTNETGFKIERKTNGGNYSQIGTVGSNITTYIDNGLTSVTTYTYRVLSYNAFGNSVTYSNQLTITTPAEITVPILSTKEITSITTTTAKSGGDISSDGGSTIIAKGVVWSTTPNPSISLTTKTSDGTGMGSFLSSINDLIPNTTFYVRAYATNSKGTAYGNQESFNTEAQYYTQGLNVIDIDGNTYPTIVTNCSQTWMQKNLNVSHYRNGDIIPQVSDPTEWKNLTTGAWCYYANQTSNGTVYGKLYNWYAVTDPRGLAPAGWHIPSDEEWTALTTCLGGESDSGGKMKEVGTNHWTSPNTGATNISGFTGLPGGYRSIFYSGQNFYDLANIGYWWSSTEYNSNSANRRFLQYNSSTVQKWDPFPKNSGFSVRCVKD